MDSETRGRHGQSKIQSLDTLSIWLRIPWVNLLHSKGSGCHGPWPRETLGVGRGSISHSSQTTTNSGLPASAKVAVSPRPTLIPPTRQSPWRNQICPESFSSVDFIHLPAQGIWLMNLSGEFPPFLVLFSPQRLTALVKVWSSSSMRRTCPKEPPRPFKPVSLRSFSSQSSPPERVPGRKEECTTCGENDIRKRRSKSRFRFLFVPISRPFCVLLALPYPFRMF